MKTSVLYVSTLMFITEFQDITENMYTNLTLSNALSWKKEYLNLIFLFFINIHLVFNASSNMGQYDFHYKQVTLTLSVDIVKFSNT